MAANCLGLCRSPQDEERPGSSEIDPRPHSMTKHNGAPSTHAKYPAASSPTSNWIAVGGAGHSLPWRDSDCESELPRLSWNTVLTVIFRECPQSSALSAECRERNSSVSWVDPT